MLAGLQGAGKTTLAGKLAKWLVKDGHTPMLVAADLQRPNAVNQLQVVGEQAGVPVFAPEPGNGVGDPVKVAKDAVKQAERAQHDVGHRRHRRPPRRRRRADEAGRRTSARRSNPDEVLFVIDAMIGQDAVATAKAFQEGVDFTGVVLSKLDGDARGGAALSVASVTGRPIIFASTGEGLDDFEPFHPDRMASRILDLGDILTLIEQAQEAFDEDEALKVAEKFATDTFTLEDFLAQMQQLREAWARSRRCSACCPGAGGMKQQLENFDEREIVRTEAIIQSMTHAERRNPKLLNGSRRLRIAQGLRHDRHRRQPARHPLRAGREDDEDRGAGRHAADPRHGPDPGCGRLRRRHAAGREGQEEASGSQSGNPAKRAAENAAIASGVAPTGQGSAPAGSGFGLGGGNGAAKPAPSDEELAALQKFLGR